MDQIYREELMEIYKNPPNRGVLKDPTVVMDETNPMCGDAVKLQLKIDDGKIVDAKFEGVACAVSIISSAFLTEEIIGKSIDEVKSITKDELLDQINLNLTTSRVKCATLILDALEKAIEKYESKQ